MKWCYECAHFDPMCPCCDKLKKKKKSHSRADKCDYAVPIQETLV